jgi:hypothetical protein
VKGSVRVIAEDNILEGLQINTKTPSVMKAGIAAKIRTGNTSNTNLKALRRKPI